jgi:hypothetical protein
VASKPWRWALAHASTTEGLDMTAWLLYLTILLAPLVLLIITMAG